MRAFRAEAIKSIPTRSKRHADALGPELRAGESVKRVVVLVAVLLVAGATALLVGATLPSALSVGSFDGDGTASETTASETTVAGTTTSGTAANGTSASDDGPYAFTIDSVEECGSTCRDVTVTLENTAPETRRNVRVTTKVYADEDLLWTGNESVGALSAGASHTTTKRVEMGLAGGMKIRSNDGYVTIVTVVRSDDGTTTFSERRTVA